MLDIDDEGANETVQRITDAGNTAMFIHTDMSSQEEIKNAMRMIVDKYNRLYIVVNNAFYLNSEGILTDMTLDVWNKHFSVNVTGPMLLSQEAIPYLLKQKNPSIINVSSTSILTGEDGNMAYACSKSALATMIKYMATQYGKTNLRVNTIIPGLILNEQTLAYAKQDPMMDGYFKVLEANILVDRVGNAKDVANVVLFIADEKSSYINGVEIRVDGGFKTHTSEWAMLRPPK